MAAIEIDMITYNFAPQFKNEREMCDLLEKNIHDFCRRSLSIDVASYKREYPLTGQRYFGMPVVRSIDFLIVTTEGRRVFLECKNPRTVHSMPNVIGQLLSYSAQADDYEGVDELVIVTSRTSYYTLAAIHKFELPIRVVLFTTEEIATWSIEDVKSRQAA